MVGGIIDSWQTSTKFTKIIVKDRPYSNWEYCSVKVQIPPGALKLLKENKPIWWHGDYVYITLEEVSDCKFKKIGFTSNVVK